MKDPSRGHKAHNGKMVDDVSAHSGPIGDADDDGSDRVDRPSAVPEDLFIN